MFNLQAGTFIQLLDGEDSDEKAVTAMGILNTLETMLNVMEASKEVGMLVYVIGLHAVQFGNNWIRKIRRTAKLDEAVG